MKLFDQKKNKGVNPERLTITTFVWWRCPNGPDHSWYKPFRKSGEILRCPFCTWRLVSKTNSLQALYPELANELHPTRNGNITAKDIPAQKWLMVWWKCSENPRHVWQARVRNRTVNKSGCPKCWVEKRSDGYFKKLAAEEKP
ncbi:MAG: zinc-ribbon domain-containing protein [Candidatus Obscuribacterales bacterium]|nr:zinc-ribbon domain-containing protein [Candidatus Obscuribacterales bacterium]